MQSFNHPYSIVAPRSVTRQHRIADGITYMKQLQFYLFIRTAMNNVLNSSTSPGEVWHSESRSTLGTTRTRAITNLSHPGRERLLAIRRPILMLFLISWFGRHHRYRSSSGVECLSLVASSWWVDDTDDPKILQCVFQPRSVMIAPAQQTGSRGLWMQMTSFRVYLCTEFVERPRESPNWVTFAKLRQGTSEGCGRGRDIIGKSHRFLRDYLLAKPFE